MKRYFLIALLVCFASAVSSCKKEPVGFVEVTFDVSVPENIGSKAVLGLNPDFAKKLTLAIYETSTGEYLPDARFEIVKDFGTGMNAQVRATLVKGQRYDVAFWADSQEGGYYTFNAAAKTVTVNYDKMATNNNLSTDAWFHVEKNMLVSYDTNIDDVAIELRRPLAQINIGTKDYASAQGAGITVTKSAIQITGVAKTLDLFSGTGMDIIEEEISLAAALIPYATGNTTLTVNFKEDNTTDEYEYLSVCYVLPHTSNTVLDNYPEKTSLVDISVDFYEDGNSHPINWEDENNKENQITNVPVLANYRTNIVGSNVLTDDGTFNLIIIPEYLGLYYNNDSGIFDQEDY